MDSAQQMIKPMLSEIRDMTDEQSSVNDEDQIPAVLDPSNHFEIAQGIKWHELVILLEIIKLHIGLVETLRGFKWFGTTTLTRDYR
jgi:hypothetical protein